MTLHLAILDTDNTGSVLYPSTVCHLGSADSWKSLVIFSRVSHARAV
jgi:hypothetical protein